MLKIIETMVMRFFLLLFCIFCIHLTANSQTKWVLTYKDSLPEYYITADRIIREGSNSLRIEGNVTFKNPIGILPPSLLRPNPTCAEVNQIIAGTGMVAQCGDRALTSFGYGDMTFILLFCTPSPMVCFVTSENY